MTRLVGVSLYVTFIFLAAFCGLFTAHAQYDLDGDGLDELVRITVSDGDLKWTAQNVEAGTVQDLGNFGVSGDIPMVGV